MDNGGKQRVCCGYPIVPVTLIKWDYIACITYERPIKVLIREWTRYLWGDT